MKAYLLSLLVTSLVLAMVGILAPAGGRQGISKHLRLIAALIWICILIAPLSNAIASLENWWSGDPIFDTEKDTDENYQAILDQALEDSSAAYFCDMLTQTLENRFSLDPGNLRCHVLWESGKDTLRPKKVTLLLSGSAVWQSPREMEQFVTELIGCECISAVE